MSAPSPYPRNLVLQLILLHCLQWTHWLIMLPNSLPDLLRQMHRLLLYICLSNGQAAPTVSFVVCLTQKRPCCHVSCLQGISALTSWASRSSGLLDLDKEPCSPHLERHCLLLLVEVRSECNSYGAGAKQAAFECRQRHEMCFYFSCSG